MPAAAVRDFMAELKKQVPGVSYSRTSSCDDDVTVSCKGATDLSSAQMLRIMQLAQDVGAKPANGLMGCA